MGQNLIRTSLPGPLVQRAVQVTHCTLFPLKKKEEHSQSGHRVGGGEEAPMPAAAGTFKFLLVRASVWEAGGTSGSNTAPLYTGLAVVLLFLSCLLLWISVTQKKSQV